MHYLVNIFFAKKAKNPALTGVYTGEELDTLPGTIFYMDSERKIIHGKCAKFEIIHSI